MKHAARSLTVRSALLGALAAGVVLCCDATNTPLDPTLRQVLLGAAVLTFGGAAAGRTRANGPVYWRRRKP